MRKFKGILVCLVILLLFVTGISARAEVTQSSSSTELMLFQEIPVVVTASKIEQPLAESPSAITVITAEDIKQSGATSIDEALRMVAGAHFGYVTQAFMAAGGIRGFFKLPDNKIMFMVDGIPEQIESYGYPASYRVSIALEEIEHIEVLRGPGSSLYGANAMMGVINVITKKTKDTHGNLISFTGGERGVLMGTYLRGGSIKDKLDYRFTVSGDKKDNWGYIAYARDPTEKYWRGNLAIDYYIDDNSQVNFKGSYFALRDGTTPFESTGPLLYGGGNDNKYIAAMTYTSREPNIMLRVYKSFMDHWKRGYVYDALRLYQFMAGTKGVDFQHTLEPFKKDTLVWGGNYVQQQYLAPSNVGKRRHDMNGIFLDNIYKFNDKFHINTGARYDKHPNTGNNLSHRLSLLYFPWKNHNFRFTWADSYRNPDFIESYYISSTVFGHEDNKAEKAENLELGYRGKLTKKLSLEANAFYTKVTDYVYFVYTTTTIRDFLNIDDLFERGTEIELKYSFTDWLQGMLNYTYLDQWEQNEMSQRESTSSVLSMTPQHMFNGQLRGYFKNGLSANLSLHYRGTTDWRNYTWYYSPSKPVETATRAGGKAANYIIANLRLGYKFKFLKNDAELGLAIFDIFDKQYDDYPVDTSSVGRRITGTFTYKF